MTGYEVRFCDYYQESIAVGQRWVREKIYDRQAADQDAAYRHFHAEPREGREVSCWERHWMEREIARTAIIGGNASFSQGLRLVA